MKKYSNKKTVSPVIAITLLLIIVVIGVISFQNFFKNYQSNLFADIEKKTFSQENLEIESLIGNSIYIKNKGENLTISQIKIGKNICNFTNSNLSLGISQIELEDCQVSSGVQNVMILTNKGILEKKFFIENGNFKENSQSNPSQNPTNKNCNFNSNSINHGASVTAFKESQVTAPNSCESEIRTCNNGILSGTYDYLTCTAKDPTSYFKVMNLSKNDIGRSIIKTEDSGIIIAGDTTSYNQENDYSIIVSKFNSEGIEQWTKLLNSAKFEMATKIIKINQGGFLISGMSRFNNEFDILLTKLNSQGIKQWSKILTSSGNQRDIARDLIQLTDNEFILVGDTRYNNNYNLIITKFNSEGNEQWSRVINQPKGSIGFSVAKTNNNEFVIAGEISLESDDILISKFNSNGVEQWTKILGTSSIDEASSIIKTNTNNLAITGKTYAGDSGGTNIFISLLNSNGVEQWTKIIDIIGSDKANQIIQTDDGGYLITGQGQFGFSSQKIFLMKFNSNGAEQWTKVINGSSIDEGYSVIQDNEGRFVITGQTHSYGHKNYDIFLLKLNSNGECNGCSQIIDVNITEQDFDFTEKNYNLPDRDYGISLVSNSLTQTNVNSNLSTIFIN